MWRRQVAESAARTPRSGRAQKRAQQSVQQGRRLVRPDRGVDTPCPAQGVGARTAQWRGVPSGRNFAVPRACSQGRGQTAQLLAISAWSLLGRNPASGAERSQERGSRGREPPAQGVSGRRGRAHLGKGPTVS